MKTFKLVAVVGVFAALSSCGGGSDTASSSTGTTTNSASIPVADCGLPDFKNEVLSRLNAYRASGLICGTEVMAPTIPVVWNELLQQAATAHATDMANNNLTGHVGSDGSTAKERQQRYGYFAPTYLFENVGSGYVNVEAVMLGWRNSAPHCKAMMAPYFEDIAVSCVAKPGSQYGYYWAMEGGR